MREVLELRCENNLHGKLDPERELLEIKCRWCTRVHGRPVFHRWPLREIIDRYDRGELNGVCQPQEPLLVHWVVKAA